MEAPVSKTIRGTYMEMYAASTTFHGSSACRVPHTFVGSAVNPTEIQGLRWQDANVRDDLSRENVVTQTARQLPWTGRLGAARASLVPDWA